MASRKTVSSVAADFATKVAQDGRARVSVAPKHAEAMALELARLGFRVAEECLDRIDDDALRKKLRAVLFGAAAGAAVGAGIGGLVAGVDGAKVGAAVGTVVAVAVVGHHIYVSSASDAGGRPRIEFSYRSPLPV